MEYRLSQVHAHSLRTQVVDQIRTAIIEGRLKPGDRITELQLTQELGVSRTPVREALILLESEGLLVSAAPRRMMIRAFTERDVADIFSLRTALENFAGRLIINQLDLKDFTYLFESIELQKAATQYNDFQKVRSIDMGFHGYLIDRTEHGLLIQKWAEIVAQIAAVLHLRAAAIPGYDERQSIADHLEIVQAYQNRDLDQLCTLNAQINQRVADECRIGATSQIKQGVDPK